MTAGLSELGRAVKQRVEAFTDDLAAKPYESLKPDELNELITAPGLMPHRAYGLTAHFRSCRDDAVANPLTCGYGEILSGRWSYGQNAWRRSVPPFCAYRRKEWGL
jgi:hypothetical protein